MTTSVVFNSKRFDTPEEHLQFYMHEGTIPDQVLSNVRYSYEQQRLEDVENFVKQKDKELLAGKGVKGSRFEELVAEGKKEKTQEAKQAIMDRYFEAVREEERNRYPMYLSSAEIEPLIRSAMCIGAADNFRDDPEARKKILDYTIEVNLKQETVRDIVNRFRKVNAGDPWFRDAMTTSDLAVVRGQERMIYLLSQQKVY